MATIDIIAKRNEKLANKVITNLKSRHFDAYYAENREKALEIAVSLINKNGTVSWGGTMTAQEIGLFDYLKENGYNCIDRDKAKTDEEREQILKDATFADTFIMSSNAVSYDGQLVNIDGTGNRVAAMIFGAKNVVMIVGMNKLAPTLEDAISRARNVAAPLNIQRFQQKDTPCMHTGACGDCKSADCICCHEVITRVSRVEGRIKVILVNDDLGL